MSVIRITAPGGVVTTMTDGSILLNGLVVGWTSPAMALKIEADPMIKAEIAADFIGLCRSFPQLFTRKAPPRCTCFEWGYGKARCPVPGHKERDP